MNSYSKFQHIWIGAFAFGFWLITSYAAAFETKLLVAPDNGIQKVIKDTSLIIAAQDNPNQLPSDIIATARADYRQILSVLYRRGYYSGTISILVDGREAAALPPFYTPNSIDQITIKVDPGKPFRFGETTISPLAVGTELPSGFAAGELARSGMIADAANAANDAWRAIGHAKSRIDAQNIVADHSNQTLDVNVALAPGPLVRFGDLTVQGSANVRETRIRQIAGFPAGVVFSPQALEDVATRLRRTGTFSSVSLSEGDALITGDFLPVTLTLTDQKPRRLGFGVEISSQEGISTSAFWLHRNIFGGAERLRFDAEISGIGGSTGGLNYRLASRLTRPGSLSSKNTAHIAADIAQLDEPGFFSQQAYLEIGIERILSERTSVSAALALRYSDVSDDIGLRTFTHLTLPIAGRHDLRDDLLNPKSGSYIQASVTPYIGLNGSTSGAVMFLDARGYYSVGADKDTTFAGRAQVGSILGFGLTTTPPDVLYYSGGGGTVRGQPFQSLNIDIGGGVQTGGLNFIGLSAEIRTKLSEKISVVAFADQGFVGSTSTPGQSGNWHGGAGLGLRYDTGVGPIRLDVAAPTNGNTGDGIQFYIGIGQAF